MWWFDYNTDDDQTHGFDCDCWHEEPNACFSCGCPFDVDGEPTVHFLGCGEAPPKNEMAMPPDSLALTNVMTDVIEDLETGQAVFIIEGRTMEQPITTSKMFAWIN